jgi:two-component system sensor histidine kinase AlgZ
MPKKRSINQNLRLDALPHFRSLGVILRAVLLANGAALLLVLGQAESWTEILRRMIDISALLQPVLLTCVLLLFALDPPLARLPYRQGAAAVLLLVGTVTLGVYHLGGDLYAPLGGQGYFHAERDALLGAATAALLLAYFRLRAQALSPALTEARLQALQARIRPHFLFNTLNAVLSIVRADPKRAETALEDMSDLFRTAMSGSGGLVPLRQEITLAHQYLALEQLRLGERLKVNWHTKDMPEDALLPPLVLQPLLENAVYHGIEPLACGGTIDVKLSRDGKNIRLEISNPRQERGDHREGNKMALVNIRERLSLQFDIEARYKVEAGADFYRVQIVLPYLREE